MEQNLVVDITGTILDFGIDQQLLRWEILNSPSKRVVPEGAVQPASGESEYWEVNNALRFVDTVTLRREHYLNDPTCGGLLRRHMDEKEKGFEIWQYTGQLVTLSGREVFARYLTYTREGSCYMSLTFSIPKVVQGNNYAIIRHGTDIIAALNAQIAPVLQQLEIPSEDISRWEVRGLDFSINFQVGDNVHSYLSYVRTRTMPHRARCEHNNSRSRPAGMDTRNNGICFKSKSVQTEFYDKEKECGNVLAAGELRMETSHRKAKSIQNVFHMKHPRLIDLTTNLCQKVLYKDLTTLGLNKEITSVKHIRDELSKLYKPGQVNRLMGFIDLERRYPGSTPKDLAKVSGLSEGIIRSNRRMLEKVDASYTVDGQFTLPALKLNALDHTVTQVDDLAGCGTAGAEEGEKPTEVSRNTGAERVVDAWEGIILVPEDYIEDEPDASFLEGNTGEVPGQAGGSTTSLGQTTVKSANSGGIGAMGITNGGNETMVSAGACPVSKPITNREDDNFIMNCRYEYPGPGPEFPPIEDILGVPLLEDPRNIHPEQRQDACSECHSIGSVCSNTYCPEPKFAPIEDIALPHLEESTPMHLDDFEDNNGKPWVGPADNEVSDDAVGDGEKQTEVSRNTDGDMARKIIFCPVPAVVRFFDLHEELLASEFFGTPTVLVVPREKKCGEVQAELGLELDAVSGNTGADPGVKNFLDQGTVDPEEDWLSQDDDYIRALLKRRTGHKKAISIA